MRTAPCRYRILAALILGWMLAGEIFWAWGGNPDPSPSRPAVLAFGRKLCPVCRNMEQLLQETQEKSGGQFEVRRLYIDEDIKLFRQYQVSIVPTLVFLQAAGPEVFRQEGPLAREKLAEKLREFRFIKD